jgi:hypothetical protein
MSCLPSLFGPGVILCFLKPVTSDENTQEELAEVTITISATLPAHDSAILYEAAHQGTEKRYLILCLVGNISSFDSQALESILQERGGQVEFDARIFGQVQIYGPKGKGMFDRLGTFTHYIHSLCSY